MIRISFFQRFEEKHELGTRSDKGYRDIRLYDNAITSHNYMEKVEDNDAAQNTGTGMAYFYQVTNVIENIIFVAELF